VQLAHERLGDEPSHLRMIVQAIEGGAQLWAGEVVRGRELLREAAAEARWYDFPVRGVVYAHSFLCVADAIAGDTEALRADARQLSAALDRADPGPEGDVRLAGERFRLARWLHAGGLSDEAAPIWRQLLAIDDPRMQAQWAPVLQLCKALLAWTNEAEREALTALTALLTQPDPGLEVLGLGTELRLRTAALALQHGASAKDVAPWLRTVLDRHAHDADLASALLAGPTVLHALAEAPARGQWSAEDAARLQMWSQRAAALRQGARKDVQINAPAVTDRSTSARNAAAAPASSATAAQATGVIESAAIRGQPLTARELEILVRLAAGDSNKLIARAFDLSPHTVKRHVANILDKLDLRSRGQAAAWFHSRHAG
jgi:LuxR family maltose regulon positive regulatory protein